MRLDDCRPTGAIHTSALTAASPAMGAPLGIGAGRLLWLRFADGWAWCRWPSCLSSPLASSWPSLLIANLASIFSGGGRPGRGR